MDGFLYVTSLPSRPLLIAPLALSHTAPLHGTAQSSLHVLGVVVMASLCRLPNAT